MPSAKSDIIIQLEKEMLALQGFKSISPGKEVDLGLGPINEAFPNENFPLAAIHEFCCPREEDTAATSGFIAGLLSPLMDSRKAVIWISANRKLFPPALVTFRIEPDHMIFIDLQKEKDVLWAMEESLKCDTLAGVVAEVQDLGFTASRRL